MPYLTNLLSGSELARMLSVDPSIISLIFSLFNYFMSTSVLLTCVSGHHPHAWHLQRPETDIEPLGIGVTDGHEPSH